LAAALAVLAAALFLEIGPERELAISKPGGGELAVLALPQGRFDHVFVHSFHLTPVRERFQVEGDGAGGATLRLYELRYQSSGVGMPEDAELGYRLEEGVFVLAMDRSFASIPLRVSILRGHGIEIEGRFWPFSGWAAPEEPLVLRGRIRDVLRLRR
jgi:hypothetical protein